MPGNDELFNQQVSDEVTQLITSAIQGENGELQALMERLEKDGVEKAMRELTSPPPNAVKVGAEYTLAVNTGSAAPWIRRACSINQRYMARAYFAGYGQITGSSTLDTALMVMLLPVNYALNLVLEPIANAYDNGRECYSRISGDKHGYPIKLLSFTMGFLVSVSTYALELASGLFKFTGEIMTLPLQVVDAIKRDIFSAANWALPAEENTKDTTANVLS
jgi:hypothetical protein